MFSDLGENHWLPQIDINAVEAQASGISLVFAALLSIVGCGLKEGFGSNSFQPLSAWEIKFSLFISRPVQVHL